jgi:hypothetical protein
MRLEKKIKKQEVKNSRGIKNLIIKDENKKNKKIKTELESKINDIY